MRVSLSGCGATRLASLLASIWVAGVGQFAVAGDPAIYSLGISNNGSTASRGMGVNDSGQVAVSSIMLFGEGTASRFDGTPGAGGALHDLGSLAGYQHAFADAINAGGQVAGYAQVSSASSLTRAFRYDGTPGAGGIMRDLGTLGGDASRALGINDSGQVTGESRTNPALPNPGTYAFVYTGTPGAGGAMTSLGSLGGPGSSGTAINNAGQVAGSSQLAGGSTHAFRYDGPAGSGVMRDLGTMPGFTDSAGNAINAGGQVAGDLSTPLTSHAFLYTGTPGAGGAMRDLGTLPGGSLSSAVGIDDAGYVLGFSDTADGLHFHPVVWRPDGSIIDLEAWLDAANPALGAQWNLSDAFIADISNTGLITGDGIYTAPGQSTGVERAFLLDASSLVPEPTCLAMFTCAIVLSRRKRFGR